MVSKLMISRLAIAVLISWFLSGCVTIYNPATERKETFLIDTRNEVAIGRDMDRQIQKKLKILDDPKMKQRLDRIGEKVAFFSDRQDLNYYFKIVNDKELNAFAIPGGFVYVNRGLMEIACDDELAGVLAHEIGHIAARHSIKKLQAALGYQIIADIALGISGNTNISQAMDIVFNLISLGYGRKDELLADKLAVRYSKRADFNPYAMISFLEKLKKEGGKNSLSSRLVFLSSHPPIEERIRFLREEIEKEP